MAALDPLQPDELNPSLRALVDLAQEQGALSNTVLARMWAHRPELASSQVRLHTRFYDSNILAPRLLELARLRIAASNDCLSCQIARKSDEVTDEDIACLSTLDGTLTDRERVAVAFAEQFADNHLNIDETLLGELRRHFTTAEMVELGMFVALTLGSGRLAYVLRAHDS